MTGTNCKAEREEPYFQISIEGVLWPILHTIIGIGNQVLKNFVDIVDNDIEIKSRKEICLRQQLGDLDENIYMLVEGRGMWDNISDYEFGTLKEFRKERNKIERILNWILICGMMKKCCQNPWRRRI